MPASLCSPQRIGRKGGKKWRKRDHLLCHPKLYSLFPLHPPYKTVLLSGHWDISFHLLHEMLWLMLLSHTWISTFLPWRQSFSFTNPQNLLLKSMLQTSYNCNYFLFRRIVKTQNLIVWAAQSRIHNQRLTTILPAPLRTVGFVVIILGPKEIQFGKSRYSTRLYCCKCLIGSHCTDSK